MLAGPLLAIAVVLRPPLGPSAEAQALEAARPYSLGAEVAGGTRLWHLEVQADSLRFGLGPTEDDITAWVVVSVDPEEPPRVEARGPAAGGQAARRLAETLRAHISQAQVRAPPPSKAPPPGRPPPWEVGALWLALAALAVAMGASHGALRAATPRPPWPALLGLMGAVGLVAAWGPDVVAYQSSHGLAWGEAVAARRGLEGVGAFGFTALGLDRLLGVMAPAGREAFWASRVAWVALVPLAYAAAATASRRRDVGLLAAALLATEPALAYMGRAEFPTTVGLALAALTVWLVVAAARRGTPPLLGAAALSLTVLATFRAMGPIVAPMVGLVGLSCLRPRRWPRLGWAGRGVLALALAGVVAAEVYQGMRLLTAASASLQPGAWASAAWRSNEVLFLAPHWSPPARGLLAVVGLVPLARRPRGALLAVAWGAAVVWLTRNSVDIWTNLPRYQAWALLPSAYLGGWGLVWLGRWGRRAAGGRRSARVLAAAVALGAGLWWGAGEVLALRNAYLQHPESAHLALWREAIDALPARAELVLPRQPVGASSPAYPLAELARRRPGVGVWRPDQLSRARATGRPVYRFDPLFCHVAYHETPPRPDVDCETLPRAGAWEPVQTRVLSGAPPPLLARRGYPPARWMLLPLRGGAVELGLYRLRE